MDSPPPVTDTDLLADFTRLVEAEGEFCLQVAVVTWPGPSRPTVVWTTFRRWKRPPTPERLAAAQQKALTVPRYFRICEMCGERNNAGHMHDRRVCQSCAERHLGVVY